MQYKSVKFHYELRHNLQFQCAIVKTHSSIANMPTLSQYH